MDDNSQKDGLLKEYELLRQSILHTEGAILQVLGIVLGAIGVIIAQGMNSGNPYTFLIALPLLIITNSYIADKRWGIWLVAYYLRNNIENKNIGLKWETWLFNFRTHYPQDTEEKSFLPGQNIMDREFWLFNIVGLLHAILFFVYAKDISIWAYSFPIIFVLILLNRTWKSRQKLINEGRKGESLKDYTLGKKADDEGKQIVEKPIESVPIDKNASNKSMDVRAKQRPS